MVQQRFGNGIGVLPRQGVKEQQLQNFRILQGFGSALQKSGPKSFPVAVMLAHGLDRSLLEN